MSDLDETSIPNEPPVSLVDPYYDRRLKQLADHKCTKPDCVLCSPAADLLRQVIADDELKGLVIDDGELDPVAIKFVLNEVIDFLEDLKLTGGQLRQASNILADCKQLWETL